MKIRQFREYELREKAFEIYSNSDYIFYENSNGKFFVADNVYSEPFMVLNGTLDDVNDFLEIFA